MLFFTICSRRISLTCRLSQLHRSFLSTCTAYERNFIFSPSKLRNSAATGLTIRTMASEAAVRHVTNLQKLDLNGDSENFPNCHPDLNPIDVYRAHIATLLSKVAGIDSHTIYPTIQWTTTLDKGDLNLAVPALKVKGGKPNDLAAKWVAEVIVLTLWGSSKYLRNGY